MYPNGLVVRRGACAGSGCMSPLHATARAAKQRNVDMSPAFPPRFRHRSLYYCSNKFRAGHAFRPQSSAHGGCR